MGRGGIRVWGGGDVCVEGDFVEEMCVSDMLMGCVGWYWEE